MILHLSLLITVSPFLSYSHWSFLAWKLSPTQERFEDKSVCAAFFQHFHAAECPSVAFIIERQQSQPWTLRRTLPYLQHSVVIAWWSSGIQCCNWEIWDQIEAFPFYVPLPFPTCIPTCFFVFGSGEFHDVFLLIIPQQISWDMVSSLSHVQVFIAEWNVIYYNSELICVHLLSHLLQEYQVCYAGRLSCGAHQTIFILLLYHCSLLFAIFHGLTSRPCASEFALCYRHVIQLFFSLTLYFFFFPIFFLGSIG